MTCKLRHMICKLHFLLHEIPKNEMDTSRRLKNQNSGEANFAPNFFIPKDSTLRYKKKSLVEGIKTLDIDFTLPRNSLYK